MIPPAGVMPITTLGATFGPAAMLGLLAILVALTVIVIGLVSERRSVAAWRRLDAVSTAVPRPTPVEDYARPWAA
jgi:hypothetical protein